MFIKVFLPLIFFLFVNALDAAGQSVGYKGEIKAEIKMALAQGKKYINLEAGTWYMDLSDGSPLLLEHLNNVEIVGNGVNIVCNRPTQAIEINNCTNIRISGISIDYDPLPFTQGKIVNMDTVNRMWLDVEIYGGYRTDMIEGRKPDRFQIFDGQTHLLRENLYTYFSSSFNKTEKKGDRLFRFYKSSYNKDACEVINDDVVFSLPYSSPVRMHTIVISQSSNISFKNVTLYAGNCFGFYETECNRNTYDHCTITRKENEVKYVYPRLRSNNADAFHSKHAVRGPKIINCTFLYHADDGIAINTDYYRVINNRDSTVYVNSSASALKIQAGHRVRFVDDSGKVLSDAKVRGIRTASDLPESEFEKMFAAFQIPKQQINTVIALTLNKVVTIPPGTIVSSLDAAGDDFYIADNTIGYTRARGILVKASNGRIQNNKILGCELGGIVLAPELNWMEAGFSRRVVIKNNLVKDCLFANSSYGIEQAAPISVVAVNKSNFFAPAGGFQNIDIVDNIIENSPLPAIMMTSASNSRIKGNKIMLSKTMSRRHGIRFGVGHTKPIWLKNVLHVKQQGNEVQ